MSDFVSRNVGKIKGIGSAPSQDPSDFELAWAKNVHEWDLGKLEPQQHEPYQEGPFIKCKTPGHDHGFNIGPLKQLVRRNGKLTIEAVVPDKPTPKDEDLSSTNSMLYH